jgi:hypothetical protein
MEIAKKVYEGAMKIIVRVADVVALAKRFEESPGLAMLEVVGHVRAAVTETLEQVMKAEIDIFLGRKVRLRISEMVLHRGRLASRVLARCSSESRAIGLADSRATWCRHIVATTRPPKRTSRCSTSRGCRRECSRS